MASAERKRRSPLERLVTEWGLHFNRKVRSPAPPPSPHAPLSTPLLPTTLPVCPPALHYSDDAAPCSGQGRPNINP